MKKIVSVFMCICLVCGLMALAGCGKGKTAEKVTAKVVDVQLTEEDYAFGVDKDQPELLEQVNAFIKEIKQNGKLEEICNKYFSNGEKKPVISAKQDDSKDQLVVATNAAFEPFEYTDGDKYLGIDMEIAAMLAEKLGKELVINNMNFNAVCLSVGQHKCDIAMAGLTVSEDRKEHVTFSESYYGASQKLIVPSNDKIFTDCKTKDDVVKKLKELPKDTKIGVQTGTTGQKYLEGDEEWEFEGYDNIKCIGYENGSLAVQDMLNGNIKYVVIDAAPADCITKAINTLK